MNLDRPSHLVALYDRCIVEETVSVLRYDLRNKLAAVRDAAFYARKKIEPSPTWLSDPRLAEMFDVIQGELAASDAIVTSRWSAVRHETERTHCDAPIRELLDHLAPTVASRIDVIATSDAVVLLNSLELQLALFCLLENALGAQREGCVAIAARLRNDGRLAIDVIDHGPGFVGEAVARHLEPFFTTRPGRVGLGLNIARRIAHRGEGALEFEARAPRGVTATLLLAKA